MSVGNVHLAIDLGASGGRVLAGQLSDSGIQLKEIHRFANGGVWQGKRLVWNLLGQWEHVLEGLSRANATYGSRIRSVGADTWGVDYVLLDRNEDLVGPCFHYRDTRTSGVMAQAFERMSRKDIFRNTGLQFMEINTAYQLFAMRLQNSPLLDISESFLMVPDYLHWQLSGTKCNEFTNASTTQLLDVESGNWSREVIAALELPEHIFSPPIQPGTSVGNITETVQRLTGVPSSTEVVVPATHDTGSAVLAVPAATFAASQPDWCYISCGTWSLMGVEIARPVTSEACEMFNFTNEGGVRGSIRLLKNIAGLWIVQQCRQQWQREGHTWAWDQLVDMAIKAPAMKAVIDPDHASFVSPGSMPQAIYDFCRQTNQPTPDTPGEFVRIALESLALRYRSVLNYLEQLVGGPLGTIHMVGGGVQNHLLCQFAADACQRMVIAGPVEATALGNVLMQAIGCGELSSIDEGRALIRKSPDILTFEPRSNQEWDVGYQKLMQLTIGQ